jgi:hypothetical protein
MCPMSHVTPDLVVAEQGGFESRQVTISLGFFSPSYEVR